MDIAYYLSDLLGQQGELSVPNLGYFVQIRMPAYYDSEAKKFYPPHFSIQFDPQVIDEDDSLAAYITGLKKISLASAKYFIEKYISNLKSQAMIENVPFANLGSFHSDGIKLIFEPGVKTDAPAFFALKPVEAYHIGEDIPVKEPAVPAPYISPEPISETETVTEPEAEQTFEYTPPPAGTIYPEQAETKHESSSEYIEEDVPTRSIGTWTVILIVLTVLAIAFVGLYKFKPTLFKEWFSLHKNPYTASQPIAPPVIKHTDTPLTATTTAISKDTSVKTQVKKDSIKSDIKVLTTPPPVVKTSAKTTVTPPNKAPTKTAVTEPAKTNVNQPAKTRIPAVATTDMPDNIAKGMWVIYGGAFPIRSSADKAISNYKSMGYVQARLLTTEVKRGNNYKVILGAYKTRAEAIDASKEMLMTHKLTLSIEQIK